MKLQRIMAVLVVVASLGACATTASVRGPDSGAIYGYFEIPKDDFGELTHVSFLTYPYKIPIIGGDRELEFVIVDGAYFAYDAPPGQYFLQSFVGTKPILKTMEFRLVMLTSDDKYNDQQIRDTGVITVKPKELVYVGAQKVSVKTQPGLFRRGETNIGPTDSISEKEVLQRVLPALAGMSWESVVKDRIAKLNEAPAKDRPPNPSPTQPLTARPLPRETSGAQL